MWEKVRYHIDTPIDNQKAQSLNPHNSITSELTDQRVVF